MLQCCNDPGIIVMRGRSRAPPSNSHYPKGLKNNQNTYFQSTFQNIIFNEEFNLWKGTYCQDGSLVQISKFRQPIGRSTIMIVGPNLGSWFKYSCTLSTSVLWNHPFGRIQIYVSVLSKWTTSICTIGCISAATLHSVKIIEERDIQNVPLNLNHNGII